MMFRRLIEDLRNGPAVRIDTSDGSFPPTPKPFMATDIAGCGKKVWQGH